MTPIAHIRLQQPSDYDALKALNEAAFGPGRFARTAYRVREGAWTDPRLNTCALLGTEIAGAVQFTPISIGGVPGAILLGPLIISEPHKNQGHGLRLMLDGLRRSRHAGYRLVVLVGDFPYYARAGFLKVPRDHIVMPGPIDPDRFLYVELTPDALRSYRGQVRGCPDLPDACGSQRHE